MANLMQKVEVVECRYGIYFSVLLNDLWRRILEHMDLPCIHTIKVPYYKQFVKLNELLV